MSAKDDDKGLLVWDAGLVGCGKREICFFQPADDFDMNSASPRMFSAVGQYAGEEGGGSHLCLVPIAVAFWCGPNRKGWRVKRRKLHYCWLVSCFPSVS